MIFSYMLFWVSALLAFLLIVPGVSFTWWYALLPLGIGMIIDVIWMTLVVIAGGDDIQAEDE